MSRLNRRDFLKLAGLGLSSAVLPGVAGALARSSSTAPNLLVLVFDAMSARNLSVYGYPRDTTPNFQKFAERALVYHNHIAGGNYTTPGTATLLTGTYPWTHRALNHSGIVLRSLAQHNVFSLLKETHTTFGYTQNSWADYLLGQFEADLDLHLLARSFSVVDSSLDLVYRGDSNLGPRALDDYMFQMGENPASLVFGPINKQVFLYKLSKVSKQGYPRGLPNSVTHPTYFRLEDVFSGVAAQIRDLDASSAPFMAYVHLLAPHEPYRPRREFNNLFDDALQPVQKPLSQFSDGSTEKNLRDRRVNYDRYIANVDAEFGKLLQTLEADGILDHTVVIVTSDHGQMFERGIHGHSTPVLYDPVVHVPMLIGLPGRDGRLDIHEPTSNTDLLPTLVHLAGLGVPSWCEGSLLPGIPGAGSTASRPVFCMEAKENSAFLPLGKVTVSIQKDRYKLVLYRGYASEDRFEMFDLLDDPEEMNDLHPRGPQAAGALQEELLDALNQADAIRAGWPSGSARLSGPLSTPAAPAA